MAARPPKPVGATDPLTLLRAVLRLISTRVGAGPKRVFIRSLRERLLRQKPISHGWKELAESRLAARIGCPTKPDGYLAAPGVEARRDLIISSTVGISDARIITRITLSK